MDKVIKEEADSENEENGHPPNLQPDAKVLSKEEADSENGENGHPPNLQPDAKPCGKQKTSPESIKPLTQCQPGSAPGTCRPRDEQEEEPHLTHSFEWCWSDHKPIKLTCNEAGTVEEVLRRSPQFKRIAGKNKDKELVILRDGKAISSHFPCRLIKNKSLTMRYIKVADKQNQSVGGSVPLQRKGPSEKLVMFHVLVKGGKNVVKIMRNPTLETEVQEITVYAYKGEKVKKALKRDGRLQDKVFEKNCALFHTKTKVITEMSNLVDDLDGETFKIILLDKCNPPDSQPGSLDDAYIQHDSQISESDANQDPPQQSTTAESGNDTTPEEKLKLNGIVISEIPSSKATQSRLLSQFKDLVKGMKTQQGAKLSRIQNLFRVDFGKNAQTCREVKTMRKLMDLSNSVCNVRINGASEGSGFLLFDQFVLTNGHVVEKVYNKSTGQLTERVTVHFSFESLEQVEGGQDSGVVVEEVVGFELCPDESQQMFDWALLRLGADQILPDGLLTHFGFLLPSGGICIIGHPDGGVKKIDPCLVVPTDNRNQVVERHRQENPEFVWVKNPENRELIQLITDRYFDGVKKSVELNRQVLTYESCFYFGSSGSPVFDEYCNVVAMHSGGYVYGSARGEGQSVIEYGYPLSAIIEHVIVQIVLRGRFDVLKKYLACDYKNHQCLMSNLKKLVESRNLTAFKNAATSSEVTSDERLKTFFEFISRKEEPVPMDTD